jgi:AraC-like DNA-binding protein
VLGGLVTRHLIVRIIDRIHPVQSNFFASLAEPFTGEALFDALGDVVCFVKDARGRYVVVNQTLVDRCMATAKADLIGRTAAEVFPAPLGKRFADQDAALLRSGQALLNELELHLYPSGRQGWCLTTKRPLFGKDGRCAGLAGTSRDLLQADESGEAYATVGNAVAYARRHLDAQLSLDHLAGLANLSRYQLDQRVRKIFRLSVGQLLLKFRMDQATQRLRDTEEPVATIGADCGYADQSAFARQFRRTVGLTPREYRRSSRAERGPIDR